MGKGASCWCYIIMQESYILNLLAYGPLIVTASNLPHRHIHIDTLLGWGCPHYPCSRSFINHSAASDECVLPPLQPMTSCSHQHLIEWLHLFVSSVLRWMEPQTITGSVTIQSDLSDLPLCYTDFMTYHDSTSKNHVLCIFKGQLSFIEIKIMALLSADKFKEDIPLLLWDVSTLRHLVLIEKNPACTMIHS